MIIEHLNCPSLSGNTRPMNHDHIKQVQQTLHQKVDMVAFTRSAGMIDHWSYHTGLLPLTSEDSETDLAETPRQARLGGDHKLLPNSGNASQDRGWCKNASQMKSLLSKHLLSSEGSRLRNISRDI